MRIAAEVERAIAQRKRDGTSGTTNARRLASGDGWRVADVICTSGPQDRPFQESHDFYSVGLVASGTFQYRSGNTESLLTPGSLMLGNAGECFECGHQHAVGDRCLAFWYTPEFLEEVAAGAGVSGPRLEFANLTVPPVRVLSPLFSRACAGLLGSSSVDWHELGVALAGHSLLLAAGLSGEDGIPPGASDRVTKAVRIIEGDLEGTLTLDRLADESRLSPFHFLRTFERLTGLTPHRYILRARLRHAAMRLECDEERVLDIALDSGFGDVSNFNRAFRAEFGISPRAYRRQATR